MFIKVHIYFDVHKNFVVVQLLINFYAVLSCTIHYHRKMKDSNKRFLGYTLANSAIYIAISYTASACASLKFNFCPCMD